MEGNASQYPGNQSSYPGNQYPGNAGGGGGGNGGPVMMATPIQAEGYQNTTGGYGYQQPMQTPGGAYPYGGQPMYAGQQPTPQQQQMQMGMGQPMYGQQPMMYPAQPQVVYVAGPPRGYGYGYADRARYVYWGNPYMRGLTLLFIALVIIGIVLEATSSTGCRSGCSNTSCYDNFNNRYACTCDGGTICENEQFGPQGQAGAALISIGVIALIVQSCIACGCCGTCCLPPPPPVVNHRPPMMMVAGGQPQPMQQPMVHNGVVVVGRAY